MSLSERSGLSSTTTKAFLFFQSHVLGRAPAGCVQAAVGPGLAPCQPPALPPERPAAGQAAGIPPQTWTHGEKEPCKKGFPSL